jgi:hypothetical protein
LKLGRSSDQCQRASGSSTCESGAVWLRRNNCEGQRRQAKRARTFFIHVQKVLSFQQLSFDLQPLVVRNRLCEWPMTNGGGEQTKPDAATRPLERPHSPASAAPAVTGVTAEGSVAARLRPLKGSEASDSEGENNPDTSVGPKSGEEESCWRTAGPPFALLVPRAAIAECATGAPVELHLNIVWITKLNLNLVGGPRPPHPRSRVLVLGLKLPAKSAPQRTPSCRLGVSWQ